MHRSKLQSRGAGAVGTILVSTLLAAGGYAGVQLEHNAATSQYHTSTYTETTHEQFLNGYETESSPWLEPDTSFELQTDSELNTDTALAAPRSY